MHYHIKVHHSPKSTVNVWSTRRLTFEPKGWIKQLRDDLRQALLSLRSQNEGLLRAVYSTNVPSSSEFDVENILFYNVGAGAFRHLCQMGLSFEHLSTQPPECPVTLSTDEVHYHSYSLFPPSSTIRDADSRAVVSWTSIDCPPLRSDLKPLPIWFVSRKALLKQTPYFATNSVDSYRLRIHIKVPGGTSVNAAGVCKPILDGVVSAFHHYIGKPSDQVLSMIHELLLQDGYQSTREEICDLLTDPSVAILGERRLVDLYRGSIKWNPADHRCVAALLTVDESCDSKWSITGEISVAP